MVPPAARSPLFHSHLSLILLLYLLFVTAPLLLSAAPPLTADEAREHVMMVNQRGQHLDPAEQWNLAHENGNWHYTNTVEAIQRGLQRFCETNTAAQPQVVVFVHGGLNSYQTSQKRLARMLSPENKMLEEGYYPILIVWNSGFVSSYLEHLLDVRQGEIWPVLGKITAPVMLAVDLGRGAVRLPLTLSGRWYNDWQTAELPNSRRTRSWESLEAQLVDWQSRNTNTTGNRLIRPPLPEDRTRRWGERLFRLTSYFLTQPTKIAVLPLADGLATEAWDNMIRRTRTMFQPPKVYEFHREYRKAFLKGESSSDLQQRVDTWMNRSRQVPGGRRLRTLTNPEVAPDGSMYDFAKRLETWSTNQVFPRELRWQFIGHSMGTIVLNEVFRVAPDIRSERVTYMAAACSIRDFEETTVPYLRRQRLLRGNTVQFYNLCLHRIRERDNSMDKFDIIPRGTLLNYIDAIFAKPATITDRTLGSWENIIPALPDVPREIRPQMHNICFDLLPWSFSRSNTNQPQNHSSFTTDFAFWKESFVKGPQEEQAALAAPETIGTPDTPAQSTPPPSAPTRQSPILKK